MAELSNEEITIDPNRLRRKADAAKLIPVLAAILMMVPILWVEGSTTSSALIYIFTVWFLLIVLNAILARSLSEDNRPPKPRTGVSETRP